MYEEEGYKICLLRKVQGSKSKHFLCRGISLKHWCILPRWANCQSVMFLLTIVQLLCVPTGANCTMPLNFFPHLLYQTMGTLVCAVWGTGSLWCVVTESLLCWPIEPGSTSVLLIEETSGQQLCNDKAIRWGHLLVWVAGPMQKKLEVTYSITQRLWLLGNFLTLDVKRKKNDFIECMEQKGAEW